MRQLRRFLLLLAACLACCASSLADVVVVVNAKSGVDRLTQDEVVNIFLGRYRKLPSGIAAVPVDQPETGELRAEFYRKLVGKDLAEINAYWARLIFSGKTSPPLKTFASAEVLSKVLAIPGGIGYIERAEADARVKVVYSFSS